MIVLMSSSHNEVSISLMQPPSYGPQKSYSMQCSQFVGWSLYSHVGLRYVSVNIVNYRVCGEEFN